MPNENQTIAIPSYNPADARSEAGMYNFLINKTLQKIEKVTPAQIISYNRMDNRAVVQILGQNITSTGEKLPMQLIPNIPVLMLSGGGFTISLPVKAGDIGWIVTADRDISVFKNLLAVFTPNTYRKHKYEDGFFIPDRVNGFEIDREDEDSLLITSATAKISLKDGQATITAGNIILNGNVTVNGTVTASGDVTGSGISLSTHVHGGVQTGGGTTGAPQ